MIDGKDIKPGAVTNTNVNSSAGIELKKLEKGGSGQIVVTDTAGTQKYVNLSGDVTVDNDGVATVSATVSSGGTGTVGPQGPTGPQGPQGPGGGQGNPGAPGSDAAVTKANIDDALYGADTSTLGLVRRTANDDYDLDESSYSVTTHTHAHSDLTSIDANQHLDWTTDRGSTNIHAGNYTDTTANETITLGGDVSGSGTTSITCTVDDDSHTHSEHSITALNTSAGASSAGKLIKLDAAGHVDATMINDADISYTNIADVPSTFAPSTHTHGTNQITGLGAAAEKDTGTTSDTVATGNHTHAAATISAAGFMSTADKTKLDGFGTTLVNKKTFDITWGTDDTATPKKFEFTGSGAGKYCTITHDLGTQYVIVSAIESNEVEGELNFVYLPGEQLDVNYDIRVTPHSTSALKMGLDSTATSAITDGTIFKVAIIG
jgi:hypothetical protein